MSKVIRVTVEENGEVLHTFVRDPGQDIKMTECVSRFELQTPTKPENVELVLKAKPQTTVSIHSGVWAYSTNTLGLRSFPQKDHLVQEWILQKKLALTTAVKEPQPEDTWIRSQAVIQRVIDEKIDPWQLTLLELGIPVYNVFPGSKAVEIKKTKKTRKSKEDLEEDQETLDEE
ncbi:TPA_asm: hypothetical protein vir519_00006 [Caudoviricetes sp. vir519]|nr:TPA_asm: hypothetical protein vir519_00006 [Caudoviricetes sp. vir519]